MIQQLRFNIAQAFRTISANLLRSIITILIIILGITALVGILTATDVMKSGVSSNFSSMGANSFQITNEIIKTKRNKGGRGVQISSTEQKNIAYNDALAFRNRYSFPHTTVGLSIMGSMVATVTSERIKTNPNVRVMGVDQNYLFIAQTALEEGRNISKYEEDNGSYVCVLGAAIAKKIFKKPNKAINQIVSVGANKFRVIGVAAEKGGSMMMDADNMVLMPLQTARTVYGGASSYVISVWVRDINLKKIASEEAEGLLRMIRKLPLSVVNNFSIQENNSLVEKVVEIVGQIGIAAMAIAIVTLLGSIIGLMNIMLVSVVERTREIGISKALGARSSVIKQQFLIESIMISLMGGLLGIFFSLLIGLALASSFKVAFVIPWAWILLGVTICILVGVVSGIYPALKASKLDPIVALRIA
ncbi:MAG: ABC transporter permease [Phycisphaerales bacterium]|nr:ABC transporter permease [Phycisphaerales bacterium]